MSWLKTVLGVVKTAAPIAANIVLPGAGSIVDGLMDKVLNDKAGYSPENLSEMSEETKAEIISKNPDLLADLEAKALELDAKIAEERTKNMSDVNKSMQAELVSGKWYQRAWRPFNGFMFPVAVLLCYVAVPIWALYAGAIVTIEVPSSLWMIWGGVLGVAVYGRNKEKQQTLPGQSSGIVKGLLNKLIR